MIIKKIKKELVIARDSIDSFGHLPYPKRSFLLALLGERKNEGNEIGYIIRSNIALNCAKKTLPTWDKLVQKNSFLAVLQFAEKCIYSSNMHNELEEVMNNMIPQVENILYENEKNRLPAYAGFSCISAISTILYDEYLDLEVNSELDIEPDQWDSAFYSSLVVAGGATWENDIELNNIARRDFWEWYLERIFRTTKIFGSK